MLAGAGVGNTVRAVRQPLFSIRLMVLAPRSTVDDRPCLTSMTAPLAAL